MPVSILAAVCCAIPGGIGAIDEFELAFRLEPGRVLVFEHELLVRAESARDVNLGSETTAEQTVELEVREVLPDGSRRCDLRYGRVRGSIVNPMIERVEFDSDTGAEEGNHSMLAAPLVAQFELTAGRTFTARVDARGRVLEVSGFVDAYRGTPVEFLYAMGGYPLADAMFVDEVQVFFALLPEAPIALDSHWSVGQSAELHGVELLFPLDCFASSVDADEAVWSYASTGIPTAPTRRDAMEPAAGLSDLSLDTEAHRWIQQGLVVDDGSMTGTCQVSTSDGSVISLRHVVRARGSIPNPTGGAPVALDTVLEFKLRRAGTRAADPPISSAESVGVAEPEWLGEVDRLFGEARPLEVGRSLNDGFSGREIALGSEADPAANLRCASFRPIVQTTGRFEVELEAPAFPAWLVVLEARGALQRVRAAAGGAARIEFDVHDPSDGVLVLVEGGASARGPFLLSLNRVAASTTANAPMSVTAFDGATLLDATSLLENSRERRDEMLAHYRLFAAAAERMGGSPSQQAHFHAQHAMACRANGEIAQARTALDKAWRRLAAAPVEDPAVHFELLGLERGVSAAEGRIGQARAALDELLAHAADPQMRPEIAALSLHDHAVFLLEHFQDGVQAAAYSREGLAIYASRSIGVPRIEAALNQVLAEGLAGSDPHGAEEALRRAAAILTVAADTRSDIHAFVEVRLADLLLRRGEVELARRVVESALETIVCVVGWDHEDVARILGERARVFDALGDSDGAFQSRQDSLAILLDWHGAEHPTIRRARLEIARHLGRLGRVDAAWSEVRKIVATDRTVAGSRLAALSESERLQYQATQRAVLDLAHVLPAESEEHARLAYDTALLAKGAVARSLDAERARLRSARPAETAQILVDLRATQAALSSASLDGESGAERVDQFRARRDMLERQLTSAAGPPEAEVLATDATRIHERLEPGSVLVDFVIHRDGGAEDSTRLAAWVTSAGAEDLVRIDLGEVAPIERAVAGWRASLESGPGRGIASVATPETMPATPAEALREHLWMPLESAVEGALRVVVCPDGFLAGVPFGALPNGAGGFLIEDVPFAYVNDASTLTRASSVTRAADELLLVGGLDYGPETRGRVWPPLPGTRREIAAVAALHREVLGPRSRIRALEGSHGTETRIRAELERALVIHVATHGFAETAARGPGDDAAQVHAGLVCSAPSRSVRTETPADDLEDGLLTAEEIAWLDLSRAELVVLSACSSGLGRAVPGEGMLGLRRAFRRAGAASVVSALWPVPDDATAELMMGFYERMWRGGLTPADALRGAQLAALNAARELGEGDSPLAWGAFVLE